MSSAREGRWDLLDHDSDPVPAEDTDLDAVIRHYEKIVEMMTTQSALLKKIGDGDTTLLKGLAADAMRKRAQQSHERLGAAAGRYEDVAVALKEYQPALKTARSETMTALTEAETASTELGNAEKAKSDAEEAGADDDENLAAERAQGKIEAAQGELEAAKGKCRKALEALGLAADRAAAKIKENWGSDGLGHSGWEAFVHKILKIIVEVLGWIGMVLAIVAMIIPGLQWVGFLALGVAVLALIGSAMLYASGESSLVNLIFGVIGVVTFGLGAVAMSLAKVGKTFMDIIKVIPNLRAAMAGLPGLASRMASMRFYEMFARFKPTIVLGRPGLTFGGPGGTVVMGGRGGWKEFLSTTWGKLGSWFNSTLKNWSWNKMLGLPPTDVLKFLKEMSLFGRLGIPGSGAIGGFIKVAGPLNFFWGFVSLAIPLIMIPSDIFQDDPRKQWAWAEWDFVHNFPGGYA